MNFNVADLFCGAGGTSTGVLQAADELGINGLFVWAGLEMVAG